MFDAAFGHRDADRLGQVVDDVLSRPARPSRHPVSHARDTRSTHARDMWEPHARRSAPLASPGLTTAHLQATFPSGVGGTQSSWIVTALIGEVMIHDPRGGGGRRGPGGVAGGLEQEEGVLAADSVAQAGDVGAVDVHGDGHAVAGVKDAVDVADRNRGSRPGLAGDGVTERRGAEPSCCGGHDDDQPAAG
jgi:hypothetical protein